LLPVSLKNTNTCSTPLATGATGTEVFVDGKEQFRDELNKLASVQVAKNLARVADYFTTGKQQISVGETDRNHPDDRE
jgi:hypothetical protein